MSYPICLSVVTIWSRSACSPESAFVLVSWSHLISSNSESQAGTTCSKLQARSAVLRINNVPVLEDESFENFCHSRESCRRAWNRFLLDVMAYSR